MKKIIIVVLFAMFAVKQFMNQARTGMEYGEL